MEWRHCVNCSSPEPRAWLPFQRPWRLCCSSHYLCSDWLSSWPISEPPNPPHDPSPGTVRHLSCDQCHIEWHQRSAAFYWTRTHQAQEDHRPQKSNDHGDCDFFPIPHFLFVLPRACWIGTVSGTRMVAARLLQHPDLAHDPCRCDRAAGDHYPKPRTEQQV